MYKVTKPSHLLDARTSTLTKRITLRYRHRSSELLVSDQNRSVFWRCYNRHGGVFLHQDQLRTELRNERQQRTFWSRLLSFPRRDLEPELSHQDPASSTLRRTVVPSISPYPCSSVYRFPSHFRWIQSHSASGRPTHNGNPTTNLNAQQHAQLTRLFIA